MFGSCFFCVQTEWSKEKYSCLHGFQSHLHVPRTFVQSREHLFSLAHERANEEEKSLFPLLCRDEIGQFIPRERVQQKKRGMNYMRRGGERINAYASAAVKSQQQIPVMNDPLELPAGIMHNELGCCCCCVRFGDNADSVLSRVKKISSVSFYLSFFGHKK